MIECTAAMSHGSIERRWDEHNSQKELFWYTSVDLVATFHTAVKTVKYPFLGFFLATCIVLLK